MKKESSNCYKYPYWFLRIATLGFDFEGQRIWQDKIYRALTVEYPLISEYREAILSAEDNFKELSSLRPVLDGHGDPVMSSGNFAVVFKMKDENDGKLYAVKCFIKDQDGRGESYRKITDELEVISSSYLLPLRYLEDELFVDSPQCERDEFPVVVMEWVEGETLDAYLKRNLNDKYELEMLSYRFNRMSAWLLSQPFAHGDLKPDNILVRKDGSLVLVDYDGMFVPSMKGEKARELGSPDYRHPLRTEADFNEHIDDFSIAVIALSLKAIALNPDLKLNESSSDMLFLSEKDYRDPEDSKMLKGIQSLMNNSELSLLFGAFSIALAKNSLDLLSFRLFMTQKPIKSNSTIKQDSNLSTKVTYQDIDEGIKDEYGVIYSKDSKRLLRCKLLKNSKYTIKSGTEIICDGAFYRCHKLKSIILPDSVKTIGKNAFSYCESLSSLNLPFSMLSIPANPFIECSKLRLKIHSTSGFKIINKLLIDNQNNLISCLSDSLEIDIPTSVRSIGDGAFSGCKSLQIITIPTSVRSIGDGAFSGCKSLHTIAIPNSVTSIGEGAFCDCLSLQDIVIPDSVISIGAWAFSGCEWLESIVIPNSVISLGNHVFNDCKYLHSITMSDSITTIEYGTFNYCIKLESIEIPNSVKSIGNGAFIGCESLQSVIMSDSVISIEVCAFKDCKSLREILFSNSLKSIGAGAFCYCESLNSIIIPDSVTIIGEEAFYWCKSLRDVLFPDSLTSIGKCAFFGCDLLHSAGLPDTNVLIEDNAFPKDCLVFVW